MIDAGYVAGVVDARGHISMTGRSPRVRVTTRRVDLITWLADRTGTTPHVDERGYERRACSEHCRQRHQHVERQSAYWNVDGARAVIVLHACLPFLVCQRPIVQTVLADVAPSWPARPRTEITAAMRRLGWPIPGRAELPEGRTG